VLSGFHIEPMWFEDDQWVVNSGRRVWRNYS